MLDAREYGEPCGLDQGCGRGGTACDGDCDNPSVPICVCPQGGLCGFVYAHETYPGLMDPIENVVVELRDEAGQLRQYQKTAAGRFVFASPPSGVVTLNLSLDRKQASSPASVQASAPSTSQIIFTIAGVQSEVRVTGPTGSFVLLSTASWTYGPPKIGGWGIGGQPSQPHAVVSGVIGPGGDVALPVRRGTYYLTCWKYDQGTFTRAPTTGGNAIFGGNVIEPQTAGITAACP
jgi:hypothetical protein